MQNKFGDMKNKFTETNDSIKSLQASVLIQKEGEEVAKRNLLKHIDEKIVFVDSKMQDVR